MKTLAALVIVLLASASARADGPASPSATAAPTATADPALESALRAIEERGKTVTDFRARFTQEKTVYLLDEPIRSAGRILYRAGKLRWETEKPEASTLVIDAKGMRVFMPRLAQVEVYEFSGKDALGAILPLFGQSTADLRRAYDVSLVPGAADVYALRLVPRSARVKRVIARIDVAIDRKTLLPRSLAYADPNGDVATTTFIDFEANAGLEDADFELRIPEGTKVKRPLGGLPF